MSYGDNEYGSIPYGDHIVVSIIIRTIMSIAGLFISKEKIQEFISKKKSGEFFS